MKISNISVELLDRMGTDLMVANVARVSMDKWHDTFKENDAGLIKFLADNGHWSPFAHPHLMFRIVAPISVVRQLAKHQVGFAFNEVSRRYIVEDIEFYIPDYIRVASANIKQGSIDFENPASEQIKMDMVSVCEKAFDSYQNALQLGCPAEQARFMLPQNMMTKWVWTGSLYGFARVCNLRLEPHAQKETRKVAEGIYEWMLKLFPISTDALVKV